MSAVLVHVCSNLSLKPQTHKFSILNSESLEMSSEIISIFKSEFGHECGDEYGDDLRILLRIS